MARRRTLTDTLMLLDAFTRQNAPYYGGSAVERTVAEAIEKAQARLGSRVKRYVPCIGQQDMDDKFDRSLRR